MENAFQKSVIGFARHAAVDAKHAQSGPRMNGRIHIAERPLIRGQLPVGVHVPLAAQQNQLPLGKGRVYDSKA